ncbi:MAG: hypothetical protein HYS27_12270 [Deltaproteobacteria bacterium]|nr:hypothetical protein [Deltaproteobacteria bacterium]
MRLGEMLIKAGVTTELNVNAALAEQRRWGGKLGQILVRMGAVPEQMLVLALSRQLGIPWLDPGTIEALPEALVQRLPRNACEQYRVLPLQYLSEQRVVKVAMADPLDLVVLDDLRRVFGTRIEPLIVGEQALAGAIRRLFGAQGSTVLREETSGPVLMDNSGEVRLSGIPRTASPSPAPPTAPTTQPGVPPLAQRVATHAHNVRAVADLLVARGVVRHDELPRRR